VHLSIISSFNDSSLIQVITADTLIKSLRMKHTGVEEIVEESGILLEATLPENHFEINHKNVHILKSKNILEMKWLRRK
jgi:hypothetical protein